MPMYKIVCATCSYEDEELLKLSERESFLAENECSCGGALSFGLTVISKTAGRWGDTGLAGSTINGVYDHQLGCWYSTSMERDKILKERGLISESDLPSGFVDDKIREQANEDRKFDNMSKTYRAKLEKDGATYGVASKAIAEMLPAHQMLKEAEDMTQITQRLRLTH